MPGKGNFTTAAGTLVREIAFTGLTANGVSNTTSTTELTLTFDSCVTGLAEGDIILTGATKGALSATATPGEYKLAISDITVADSAEHHHHNLAEWHCGSSLLSDTCGHRKHTDYLVSGHRQQPACRLGTDSKYWSYQWHTYGKREHDLHRQSLKRSKS